MRVELCDALVRHCVDPKFVFLTGDLGFMALEPLQEKAGGRFINAGVAEQNMVGVAAGLASQGLSPWLYSIAPFIYARPFEQIRNDVCLHDLPVKLIGNGGGYAYGVMGATHHALEDYGVLLTLPNLRAFVPAFGADIPAVVEKLMGFAHPAYLRLGRDEKPKSLEPPPYSQWRKVTEGRGAAVVAVGPIAGALWTALLELVDEEKRPNLWVLSELPVAPGEMPEALLGDIAHSGHLAVVEEHVAHGGAGEMLARNLLLKGLPPKRFSHFHAQGYLSGYYGSQLFHRQESNLAP
ncbi:MAG TPA: transketolase, partial [bacterium]|nr:transketolase [bacterium]